MTWTTVDTRPKATELGDARNAPPCRPGPCLTHPAVPRGLEFEIWCSLRAASVVEGVPVSRLMRMIDGARCALPRERAIRLFAIGYVHALRAGQRRRPARASGTARPWAQARALTAGLDAVARGRI